MYVDPNSSIMQIQTIIVYCGVPLAVVSGIGAVIYYAVKAGVKAGINSGKQTKKDGS